MPVEQLGERHRRLTSIRAVSGEGERLSKPVRAVLFDLYGTLLDVEVDEDQPHLWETLAELLVGRGQSVEPEDLKARFVDLCNTAAQRYGHGFILPVVFAQLLTTDEGAPGGHEILEFAALFRRTSILRLSLRPYARELLTTLSARRIWTAIVSNTESILTNVDIGDTGLRPYFQVIVLSSDVGLAKPDPRILMTALRELGGGISGNEAVFVGDTWDTDIVGARAAGLKAIFLEERAAREIKPQDASNDVLRVEPELDAILEAIRLLADV